MGGISGYGCGYTSQLRAGADYSAELVTSDLLFHLATFTNGELERRITPQVKSLDIPSDLMVFIIYSLIIIIY